MYYKKVHSLKSPKQVPICRLKKFHIGLKNIVFILIFKLEIRGKHQENL